MHQSADGHTVKGFTNHAARLADGVNPPTVHNSHISKVTKTTQKRSLL
jgi:hypothetical protein